jgi:hypothetical protein
MTLEDTIIKCATLNTITNITTPTSKIDYLIKVDFIANTTTVYQLCDSGVRTKVLTLPYDFSQDERIKRPVGPYSQHKYAVSVWLEYNLSKNLPPIAPAINKFICHSCKQECINSNPRFNLYWHCKSCPVTYYLDETPPHNLNTITMSCQRDENTSWSLTMRYYKNTTTLSYHEDKCEVEVLKLDFIVTNVFASNLKDWIDKKLIFL